VCADSREAQKLDAPLKKREREKEGR